MNKKNLEILGLSEGATEEDIKSAYETLKAKYLEERFMDGEAGNNAAKMLTKIEVAYSELIGEMNESTAAIYTSRLKDISATEIFRKLNVF